ncbi:MAG: hypothetical protein JWR78_4100 [Mycobacterium sp.]|nr:hypothetical protein [Mycobacterium sp.]
MLARPLIQAPLGKGRLAAVSRLRMSSRSMNWITWLAPTRASRADDLQATGALTQSTIIRRICPRNGGNHPGALVALVRQSLLCSSA